MIDFLPRLLYNKTVQGAAPAEGKYALTATLLCDALPFCLSLQILGRGDSRACVFGTNKKHGSVTKAVFTDWQGRREA